ncbi:MAG: hypothetical protein JST26_18440 [Bacteroidetes bacterium]|nr:hypothetical protein [Bacteroidota bacterium]
MLRYSLIGIALFLVLSGKAQNDQDALRYSQIGFGGTSRSKAMGGSFGALGADGSCMSINPAGIGLYKKGDVNISFGLRFFGVNSKYQNTSTNDFKASLIYDGFSLTTAWDSKQKPESHNAFGISVNQLANFNSNTTIIGYSRNSRTQDMLAQTTNTSPKNLDGSYSGLAFQNYILDTIDGHYYSFVDPTKSVRQKDQIQTSGHYNELCLNYAYGYMDKLYIGATLGIPIVNYNYTSTYTETDDKDSMRITYNASNNTVSSTYPYSLYYYTGLGGFKEFTYTESYKTTGTGFDLKLGAIYRLTDYLRVGASYQSPTIIKLTDTYLYQLSSTFDEGPGSSTQYPPDNGGRFSYKIITPQRITGSVAFLYKKFGAINVDYESVNYGQASIQNISGGTYQADFSGVNTTIRNKYTRTSNLRVGAEVNIKPMFIRLGYAMYGSPYGDTFTGSLVRNYASGGFGFRNNKFYVDISLLKQFGTENYYMFNPKYVQKAILTNSGTTIAVSIGCKF